MTGYDDRARDHIKALATELKDQAADAPQPAQPFMNGMITGIASTVEIIKGGTAEDALITVNQRLAAAVGQAYLDGKLPEKPTPDTDDDGRLLSSNEVRGIQAWMAMDVHQALGWSRAQGLAHQGRTSWGDWWAELCSGVRQLPAAMDTLARVRQLSEMTIEQSCRADARDQAHDTLAILNRANVASPTAVMTTVGAPVTEGATSGITAPPVQCWHTEAGTPCTSTQCNQPDRLRMGDYGDVPNDQVLDGTTLETPILAEQLAEVIENALLAVIPNRGIRQEVSRRATNDVLAVILPGARITAGLARDADAGMKRVIALYEQWVKAGPPKLGTPIAREWDRRLAEFHRVIKGPGPTDPS